jgi:hypothetical protein
MPFTVDGNMSQDQRTSPLTIDDLLALHRDDRLAALSALRGGQPGPSVIVQVRRTVRSLSSGRDDQDL